MFEAWTWYGLDERRVATVPRPASAGPVLARRSRRSHAAAELVRFRLAFAGSRDENLPSDGL
jgi:hypothetical protein